VGDSEFPLRLRVNLGPREDIAKLFLLDRRKTKEINHEVAQFLK
jgi:Ras association domain-containing protein 2/4